MSNKYVNLTIPYTWQLKNHPHIKITRKGMVIDSKKGKILKYNQRGFFISGKYYKRNDLRKLSIKPVEEYVPF